MIDLTSRLPLRRRRRIPFIQQLEAADCGAACLTMVLRYFGCKESSSRVRDAIGTTPFGVSAKAILDTGTSFGLIGRALRLSASALQSIPIGSIIHWEFNHFVVLDKVVRDGVRIVDPAVGRRIVSHSEVARKFTGLAIAFEPGHAFTRTSINRSPTFSYFSRIFAHHGIVTRILVASFLVQILGIVLPAITGVMIDRVVPNDDRELFASIILVAVLSVVFNTLASFARSYAFVNLRARVDVSITTSFIVHMLNLPYSFFQRRSVGDLMLRVHSNTSIREIFGATAITAMLDGTMIAIYAVVICVVSPFLALVVLGMALLKILVLFFARRGLTESMAEELYSRSLTHSQLMQVLTGIHTLKAVGAESEAIQIWSNHFVHELKTVVRRQMTKVHMDTLLYFLENLAPVVLLAIGGLLVLDGSLSLGTMLALSALSSAFLRPLGDLVKSGTALFEVQSHLERLHDVMNAKPEATGNLGESFLLRGGISLENVSFAYEGSPYPTLRDINLTIQPGQSVAIVGPSGCGKSTLAQILLGLYPPTTGVVRYDGRDLQGLSLRNVRRALGFVPQNPYLFEASIRENIALTRPDSSLEEVAAAGRLACIDEEIRNMFSGYDTRLTANGESLSGGQRQRIAIARALLAKPRILILDEATSALDAVTESALVRNLESLRCTRVIIAHRLSTIMNADVIVVMLNGHIVDVGKHSELVDRKGAYSDLLAAQLSLPI